MPTCGACGQDNPEIARFCLACGAALVEAPAPASAEERRVVTAVFTDLVGSTSRGEQLDPEDVRAMLVPYYARVRRELEAHGGAVEKFIGDAVVALFGAPIAHEDDPERAVRAALAIGDAIAELNESDPWLDLRVRTAVNTGEALVVLGARAGEGEGMAAGDVMNTAARLQGAAPVNGVVVGDGTYRATRHAVEYRELEPLAAKGKAEPVGVWEVVGLRDAVPETAATALVGRAAELELLHTVWTDVQRDRQRRLVTVVGAPGVGKSRLVAEFSSLAVATGSVHSGRCLSYGEGITYWPITEIVKSAAGVLQSDDGAAGAAKLGALLDGLRTTDQDELRTMAAALANLLGVATTPRGTYSATEISQAELHWGVRRVLELLAEDRPLVLVFEDVHWAEPTLLDLLRFLLDGTAEVPLLVVATGRPELLEGGHSLVTPSGSRLLVELDALDEAASRTLLAKLTPEGDLPPALVKTVLQNAAGNPLFLEEMVRMLLDEQLLGDGASSEELESLPVPATLHALLSSRLDRLPADAKHVVQHAAVTGAVFWSGAVAELAERDVAQPLEELERRDFVRVHASSSVGGETEYGFKHALIRDVAYSRLPKGRRAVLHARFADWVNALPGPQEEFVEIVAYHLEQSCRVAREIARSPIDPPLLRAADALRRSAEKAKRREGTREAYGFYTRALELVGGEDREVRLELVLGRSRIIDALGDLREARGEYERVVDEAAAAGRLDIRGAAMLALANLDQRQGHAAEARRRLDEAAEIASTIRDRALQVRAIFESANLRSWFEGEVEAAAEDLRRALALTEEIQDRALRVEAYMRLGTLLFNVGALVEAEQALLDAAAIAAEDGSFRDETRVMSILAYVKYFRDVEQAERLATQAVDRFERTCDSYLQAQNLRLLAKCALARGDPELAEKRLRDALPLALEGGGWVVVEIYRYLVEALVEQGRLDDARELLVFAARNLPEEDPYARAAALLAEAMVTAAEGERVAASAAFAEVLALLEKQKLLFDLGEARMIFARALRKLGENAGAQTELERARQLFMRMGAPATVAEIDRMLAELRAGAGASGPRDY